MSPERQARFLEALRITWSVKEAARAVGVRSQALYSWRKRDKAFAEAWDETLARGTDALDDEAARSDPEGHLDPAFDDGVACVTVRKTGDRILMCLLKAHRPERYKEHHGFEHEEEQSNKCTPDAINAQTRRLSSSD